MSSSLVVVAIPDENDRVWKVSSDKIPHLTLLFLGDTDNVANLDQITLFVEHAANTALRRFYLPVDRRGELGADQADVLFFKKGRYDYKVIRDFRAALLQDNNIKTAYDSTTQFEGPWNPHLTLGYPETPANPDSDGQVMSFYDVGFNKIAVWTGDFDGPEFLLKDGWDEFDTLEAVPMDVAMSDISHHGVKGQRWGIRKEKLVGAAKTVGKAAGSASRFAGDVGFEANLSSETGRNSVNMTIMSKARTAFKRTDLPAINAKPEHVKASKLKNRLLHPRDPGTKAYRKEVKEAYIQRLESAANSMTNISGTRQYTIRERGWELPAEGGALPRSKNYWAVTSREIKHADGEFTATVEVIMDEDGFITDLKPVENILAQTTDLGSAFILEHYGIKGMHWGVRRHREVSATGHVDTGLLKRRTKVLTKGGEAHPAHDDAVVAAIQKQKVKKSGTDALSTQELRELANRLQVESQVSILMSSKGKRFVQGQLEAEGKKAIKKGARKAAPHVIKRAGKSAATVATTAALL
jgi:2'-5' RNA ligase